MSFNVLLPEKFDQDYFKNAFDLAEVHAILHAANTGEPEPEVKVWKDDKSGHLVIGFTEGEKSLDDKTVEDYARAKYNAMELRTPAGIRLPQWDDLDADWKHNWVASARRALEGSPTTWFTLAHASVRAFADAQVREYGTPPETIEQRARKLFHAAKPGAGPTGLPVFWVDQDDIIQSVYRKAALEMLAREDFERDLHPEAGRWGDLHPVAQSAFRLAVQGREPK